MRTVIVLAAVAALAGCGGGDPWVGQYQGTTISEGQDCDTGEAVAPESQDTTARVERGDRGLFVAGRCAIFLDELSDSVAEVVPLTCDYALDDGTPVSVRIVSGRALLDGDELSLDYSSQLEHPGGCITAHSTFVGYRL